MNAPTLAESVGYLAAALTLATFSLRTMIPVRIAAIGANWAFITYSIMAGLMPTLILHAILLPINAFRLRQMLRLAGAVREAAGADLDVGWLRPFMRARQVAAGETIFSRGEAADAIYFVASGAFRLREIDAEIGPGEIVGELGLVAHENRRTQSLVCIKAGELLSITYDEVRRLHFQNPLFAFYLLKLVSGRLLNDIARLQDERERWMSMPVIGAATGGGASAKAR